MAQTTGTPFDAVGNFRRRSRDYLDHRAACPSCQANFECAVARPMADDLHTLAAELDLPCPDCEPSE